MDIIEGTNEELCYLCNQLKLMKESMYTKNFCDNVIGESQPMDVEKCKHPPGTLITTLRKPAGVSNTYERFGYVHRKNFHTPKDKFWDKKITMEINAISQVNNQQ